MKVPDLLAPMKDVTNGAVKSPLSPLKVSRGSSDERRVQQSLLTEMSTFGCNSFNPACSTSRPNTSNSLNLVQLPNKPLQPQQVQQRSGLNITSRKSTPDSRFNNASATSCALSKLMISSTSSTC